jgi:endonuclease III
LPPRSYVREARRRVAPKRERIRPIIDRLAAAHPDATIALESRSDLELLVAVMLSAQTTDVNVNRVTEKLFVKYKRPEDYLAVPPEELERDIFATGFYRQKAKSLRGTMQMLLEEFDGQVPRDLDQLVRLPGVARKTANVVAAELGNPQGIVVDTHVRRLSQRLALTRQDDPVKIERDLIRLVPRPDWGRFPHLLIWHGRRVCIARLPRCEDCVLTDLCPSSRVDAAPPLQHPGSRSFELVVDAYERGRPEYPREAIAWITAELDLRPGRTVLDVGAGTGKLTRALVESGARVIAVEPGDAMLAELRSVLPAIEALRGAAEAIPLEDASVDAITAGSAFHWFRHDETLPEFHRVLRPGGAVALLWNSRDRERPLQREISELIKAFVPAERPPVGDSVRAVEESPLFAAVEHRTFPFSKQLDADGVADRIASISFVAAAPPDRRAELDRRLREVVAAHGGVVEFAYVTEAYVSRAV